MTHDIQLEVRSICAGAINLTSWAPADPVDVWQPLTIEVGVVGEPGADLFAVMLATADAMKRHMPRHPKPRPRVLVVDVVDPQQIVAQVHQIVAKVSARRWLDAVTCLEDHFDHEYADYRP